MNKTAYQVWLEEKLMVGNAEEETFTAESEISTAQYVTVDWEKRTVRPARRGEIIEAMATTYAQEGQEVVCFVRRVPRVP